MRPSYGCVVLTQGRRLEDLDRALSSLLRQRGVDLDVVVVGNGWKPEGIRHDVRAVAVPENLGVPGGRNAGVPHVRGELLLFLDDDAGLPDEDALERIARLFADDPALAVVQPRVVDPAGRPGPREWVPRLRVGDRTRSSEVTIVHEAIVVFRRRFFDAAGGWPDFFFFFNEGVDLTWRLLDAGHRAWYAGDIVALHPVPRRRRGRFDYFHARNRVWLARRNLPLPLAAAHAAIWLARYATRAGSLEDARQILRGYRAGLTTPPPDRRPLRWRTIWKMTTLGRPPVV